MKAMVTAIALLGMAATVPAWAGEGSGSPFEGPTPGTAVQMSMKSGGLGDPFSWSAHATNSQYSERTGGAGDPFSWSTSPAPAASATRHASATSTQTPHG